MSYDSESDRIVLFGGQSAIYFDDTWAYDYNSDAWTQMSPATHPALRRSPSMAYDSESDRMVLYGGTDGSTTYSDTWEYDLNTDTWTQKSPVASPSLRYGAAMTYDSENDRIVLFGGYSGGYLSDTWEYDLNSDTWTQKSPAANPSARRINAMTYDVGSDRIVLFGGYNGSYFGDTWEYNLNTDTWTQKAPASPPSNRYAVGFAYDIQRDTIVLFGGWDGVPFGDTWEYDYDVDSWAQVFPATSPSVRYGPLCEYDSESDRVILFGGYSGSVHYSDTWEYTESVGIELTEFTATKTEKGILLEWRTESEINNVAWDLARKCNSCDWERIATIPSGGNSAQGFSYSYIDEEANFMNRNFYRLGSVDLNGNIDWVSTILIDPSSLGFPIGGILKQNYPNPFSSTTTISFELPRKENVNLTIYNIAGQKVVTLINETMLSGEHNIVLDSKKLENGIYFYNLKVGGFIHTKRMSIVK